MRIRNGGVACFIAAPLLAGGCASAPLDQAGSLASYSDLSQSDGILARSRLRISRDAILAARTVNLVPTVFSMAARDERVSEPQRRLIANAIDRRLCAGLGERFQVVPLTEQADLTVHAVVTRMTATDETAVGVSKVASIAKSVLLPGVPVPVPRIPIGLGSLSVEAEARARDGTQQAAMVWGRGASVLDGGARVSSSGDAYELSSAFGDDFSRMLVRGESPFNGVWSPPSIQKVQTFLGGAPKHDACAVFGREPGFGGFVGGMVGAPPEWTDNGLADTTVAAQAR